METRHRRQAFVFPVHGVQAGAVLLEGVPKSRLGESQSEVQGSASESKGEINVQRTMVDSTTREQLRLFFFERSSPNEASLARQDWK
jgi:hypothetical protein